MQAVDNPIRRDLIGGNDLVAARIARWDQARIY